MRTKGFLEKINVSPQHMDALLSAEAKLAPFAAEMQALQRTYCEAPPDAMGPNHERFARFSEATGVHPYTIRYLFYARCAPWLLAQYKGRGIDEAVFWDTMGDLRYKLTECLDLFGVVGTGAENWYARFFRMQLFALGRLQFEIRPFARDVYEKGGYQVRKGDMALAVHIPSSGPLTPAGCADAYARAHDFFRPFFGDGPTVFTCDSWLLYPDNRAFLPEGNILRFMRGFDIIDGRDDPEFRDGWRVFGKAAGRPPEELPTDTALQKAFAARLAAGHPVGIGYGVRIHPG